MNRIKHKTLGFITVTGVKVSDDLRNATVYLSVLNSSDTERTVRKLNKSASFIKGELGRRLRIRRIPALTFMTDAAIEYGRKIDGILDNLDHEGGPPDNDEDLF